MNTEEKVPLQSGLRPDWDSYFLNIALAVSTRADCTRRKVGAVLVDKNHRIISTGFNGAPPSAPGCLTKNACPRGQATPEEIPPLSPYGTCISVHAEANAIIFAEPEEREGTTLYITCAPCTDCHQLILAVGIKRSLEDSRRFNRQKRQFHNSTHRDGPRWLAHGLVASSRPPTFSLCFSYRIFPPG